MRHGLAQLRGSLYGVLIAVLLLSVPSARLYAQGADEGAQAFAYLHSVATHPRCVNCHGRMINGEFTPTVGDDLHPHPMNIKARITELGMACTTCHQVRNSDAEHLPPGAVDDQGFPGVRWQMPPPGMILTTTMTPGDLCALWTDPNRNAKTPGERGGLNDLATFQTAFLHHVDDPLVLWAFAPGPGRTPAPGNRQQLVAAMTAWIAWLRAGHTCNEL